MAKDFTKKIGGKNLSSLIPTEEVETPKKSTQKTIRSKASSPKPKKKSEGTVVKTFRVSEDTFLGIKAIAFWDRKQIQDVVNDAFETYLQSLPESTLKKAKAEFVKRNK